MVDASSMRAAVSQFLIVLPPFYLQSLQLFRASLDQTLMLALSPLVDIMLALENTRAIVSSSVAEGWNWTVITLFRLI